MPIVRRIFRYPDGHEEEDIFDSLGESYGMGESVERGGIHWKAHQGRSLFGQGGFDSEIIFVPDAHADATEA